jgi:hypothetical protein
MMPKKEFHAKTQRPQRKSYKPLTIRTMPSLIKATLKLINNPKRIPESFRYVRSCLLWTGRRSATDLISTITFSSTTKSARNPISNRIPSKKTGIICSSETFRPRFSNALAITPLYTLSNRPGPSPRWRRRATSTISCEISFSVTLSRNTGWAKMDLFLCGLCAFAREKKEFHAKTQRTQSPKARWTWTVASTISFENSLSVTSSQNIGCVFARGK